MNHKRAWIEKRLAVCQERFERASHDAEACRNLALALVDAGRPEEAEELLRGLLASAPDDAASWGVLAYALRERPGARSEREGALRRALALDPDYAWAVRELSAQLESAGRLAEAEALLRENLAGQPEDGESLLALGLLMRRRGRFDEETRLLRRALKARPLLSAAARALAAGQAAEGDLDGAVALLRRQLAEDPLDPANLLELGRLLGLKGDRTEAEALIRQAYDHDPFSPATVCGLAWFLCGAGEGRAALELLDEHLAREGEDPELLSYRGRILQETGDVEGALSDYRRALDLDPRLAWVRRELWDMRLQLGQGEELLEEVRASAWSPEGEAEDLGALARILLGLDRREAAEEALRQALARDPFFSWAARELARLLEEQGRRPEALAVLRERIARGRADSLDHSLLAELLRQGRSSSEVEHHLRQALRLDSQNGWALRELALLVGGRGETGTAEALLTDRLRSPAAESFDFGALGWLLQRQNRHAEALAYFLEALKRDPVYNFALDRAVGLLLRLERAAEAEGLLRKSLAAGPETAALHGRLAEVLLARGDLEGLERTLERALELDPSYLWGGCKLAELFHERGEPGRAVAVLEALLAREPKDAFAWSLLARVRLSTDAVLAEQAARRSLELDAAGEEATRMLILALAVQERWDEALATARRAFELFQTSAWPLSTCCGLLSRLGRHRQAEALARDYMERFPEDPRGAESLALALVGQGRNQEAASSLEECLASHPDDAGLLVAWGRALNGLGRFAEAEDGLRRAVASGGREPAALLWLAHLLLRQGARRAAEGLSLVRQAVPRLREQWDFEFAGRLLRRLGAPAEAVRVLLDSGSPDLQAQAAVLQAHLGQEVHARQTLSRLPGRDPRTLLARAAVEARSGRRLAAFRLVTGALEAGLRRPPRWFREEGLALRLWLRLRRALPPGRTRPHEGR